MAISKKALKEKLVDKVIMWAEQVFIEQKENNFDYCSLSFDVELGAPEADEIVMLRTTESYEDLSEMAEEGECCDPDDRH